MSSCILTPRGTQQMNARVALIPFHAITPMHYKQGFEIAAIFVT